MKVLTPILIAMSLVAGATSASAQTACHYDSFAHAQVCNGPAGRQTNGSNPWARRPVVAPPQAAAPARASAAAASQQQATPSTRADSAYLHAQAPSLGGAHAAPVKLNGLANPVQPFPHKRTCTRVLLFAMVNCH
jgi:hypothetical protein